MQFGVINNMRCRLQAKDHILRIENGVQGLQALEVQIDIEPPKMLQQKIAYRISSTNGVLVAIVDRQEVGIIFSQKSAIVSIAPKPVFPAGMVLQPGVPQKTKLLWYLSRLPSLVDDMRDHGWSSGIGPSSGRPATA